MSKEEELIITGMIISDNSESKDVSNMDVTDMPKKIQEEASKLLPKKRNADYIQQPPEEVPSKKAKSESSENIINDEKNPTDKCIERDKGGPAVKKKKEEVPVKMDADAGEGPSSKCDVVQTSGGERSGEDPKSGEVDKKSKDVGSGEGTSSKCDEVDKMAGRGSSKNTSSKCDVVQTSGGEKSGEDPSSKRSEVDKKSKDVGIAEGTSSKCDEVDKMAGRGSSKNTSSKCDVVQTSGGEKSGEDPSSKRSEVDKKSKDVGIAEGTSSKCDEVDKMAGSGKNITAKCDVVPTSGGEKNGEEPSSKSDEVDKKPGGDESGEGPSAKSDDVDKKSGSGEHFTKPGTVRRKLRRPVLRVIKTKSGRIKFVRKRTHGGLNVFKRRTKEIRVIVPPTKFLLGGNINDPLNLNSLQDEEINRAMNAVTPKSSPLPTPQHRKGEIEVILPRNLKDPLLLTSGKDGEDYLKLLSKKKRKRKRKRGNSGSGSGKEESFEAVIPVEEPAAKIEGAFVPPDTVPGAAAKREEVSQGIKDATKKKKPEGLDKIVSPVVPQPGARKRNQPRPGQSRKRKGATTPKFNPRNQRYQYGNYDRYYGYRNANFDADLRLQCFAHHSHLFLDKDILDIGCNIGHVTLCVARDMGARSVVGLDIDKRLVGIARKNVQHYVTVAETPAYSTYPSTRMPTPHTPYTIQDSPANKSPFRHQYVPNSPANQQSPYYQYSPANRSPFPHQYVPNSPAYHQSPCPQPNSPASRSPFPTQNSPANPSPLGLSPANEMIECQSSSTRGTDHPSFFPISMPILYGPLDLQGFSTPESSLVAKPFPNNVSFVQGSYVLESDALLQTEMPQFDVIMCLSVTKWIHLNWGDGGLKRAFRRMFAQLRPGGKLILEPQGWPSYNRKKKLTEQIYRNYMSIELLPDKFVEYLLSPAVGFSSVEEIGAPPHPSKGFRRPIHVLTKAGQTPSSCNTPVCYTPYSQRTCVRKPVYTSLGAESFDDDDKKGKK